jgi:hypothetical protein
MRRGDRIIVKILTRLFEAFRFVGCRGDKNVRVTNTGGVLEG